MSVSNAWVLVHSVRQVSELAYQQYLTTELPEQ